MARCFADMVDLKSPNTVGHSSEVARLAETAARTLGLAEGDVVTLRRAALLHDLGRVGVSSGVWEKKGPLTRSEWEQIRLHPYHTERILSCSPTLAPLGWIAGLHHERLDGSGYHHGVSAAALPTSARILAAADTFQTATQDRPHRPARSAEQAAEHLTAEAAAGRLDADCVAASHRRRRAGAAAGTPGVALRPQRPRGRGAAAARPWPVEPGDRQAAGDLQAHRRASCPAHLHQDRSLHPGCRGALRDGARPAHSLTNSLTISATIAGSVRCAMWA